MRTWRTWGSRSAGTGATAKVRNCAAFSASPALIRAVTAVNEAGGLGGVSGSGVRGMRIELGHGWPRPARRQPSHTPPSAFARTVHADDEASPGTAQSAVEMSATNSMDLATKCLIPARSAVFPRHGSLPRRSRAGPGCTERGGVHCGAEEAVSEAVRRGRGRGLLRVRSPPSLRRQGLGRGVPDAVPLMQRLAAPPLVCGARCDVRYAWARAGARVAARPPIARPLLTRPVPRPPQSKARAAHRTRQRPASCTRARATWAAARRAIPWPWSFSTAAGPATRPKACACSTSSAKSTT